MTVPPLECQLAQQVEALRELPWSSDRRGDDKTRLLRYALEHPEGTPIIMAVRDTLNADSDGAGADYQLANRFYSSHAEYFKIDSRDRHRWVEPRPVAFHLTTSKHHSKPHDEGGVAKSNVTNALKRRRAIKFDSERGLVLGGLGAKRGATEGKWLLMEGRGQEHPHLVLPYRTLYNSSERVDGAIARYHTAWSTAAAEHDIGVLITLTTDPSRYDSIADATEGLMDDLNRLKSWLANRFFDGRRPHNIAVPEFTQKGLPHLHVAFFGTDFVPQPALAHYWDQRRDRGSIVWIDGMRASGGQWRWRGRPERTETCSPQTYLGKGLQHLKSLAAADADCVKEAAGRLRSGETTEDDEAHEWWRLACRWALDVKPFTASPSLTERHGHSAPCESERAPQWRFIGASRYDTIPGHVFRERFTGAAESRIKPPPE